MNRSLLAVAAMLALASNAVAAEEAGLAALAKIKIKVDPVPASAQPPVSASRDAATITDAKPFVPYLDPGSWSVTLGGGFASNFSNANDGNIFGQVSWFVAKNLEVGVELGGWRFDQPGKDAWGLSTSLAMKYHFRLDGKGDTTFFIEGGIGVLLATNQVPAGGTNVDFMPRLGAGMTFKLSEDARLTAGVRWHHISNARIKGDSRNPGRDGAMAYIGITIPLP